MEPPFPPEVIQAAERLNVSPALAFGLGEGLNLYYARRFGERPPHHLTILPPTWESRLLARVEQPRAEAIAAALAGNGYGVMVCTGDWHGLDAIEKWAEDLSLWRLAEGGGESVVAAAALIERTDGLYRRSYRAFLDEAMLHFEGLEPAHALLGEIADDWLDIARRLHSGDDLARLSSRLLRMAGRESRFWGLILDRFGQGI